MKVGDTVTVPVPRSSSRKYGIVISLPRRRFMAGNVVEILVDGKVIKYLSHKVEIVEGDTNESKRSN